MSEQFPEPEPAVKMSTLAGDAERYANDPRNGGRREDEATAEEMAYAEAPSRDLALEATAEFNRLHDEATRKTGEYFAAGNHLTSGEIPGDAERAEARKIGAKVLELGDEAALASRMAKEKHLPLTLAQEQRDLKAQKKAAYLAEFGNDTRQAS